MSDPENKTTSSAQPFDIDSVEMDLLIVCKSPAAFQQSASFLTRRGWPTTVVGNLSRAIDQVIKTNPDFVLISVNHPNPAVQKLPFILSGTFQIPVIGFVEANDAVTASRLLNSGVEYKLTGLPSGPNIERFIRKILIDLYSPQDKKGSGTATAAAPSEGQSLSTSHGTLSNPIIGRSALHKGDLKHSRDIETVDVGTYTMTTRRKRRLKDLRAIKVGENPEKSQPTAAAPGRGFNQKDLIKLLGVDATKDAVGESSMMFLPSKEQAMDGRGDFLQEGSPSKSGRFNLKKSPQQEDGEIVARTSNPNSKELSAKSEGHLGKLMEIRQEDLGESGPQLIHSQSPSSQTHVIEKEESKAASGRPTPRIHLLKEARIDSAEETLLQAALNLTLPKVCEPRDPITSHVSRVETIGVLSIDSPHIHGYLIICASQTNALELEFLNSLRVALLENLRGSDPGIKMDDTFIVSVESFEYHEWVSRTVPLSILSQHKGIELGISFLPTELRMAEPKESDGMTGIPVGAISPEAPVTFKAYLHFERNNRYYLYLRNGRKLRKLQKERLLGKNIKEFYIKTADLKNYRTYAAAQFINQMLRKNKSEAA